jgi:5-methyltetrahydropteroyltriglutamate--homocysteine methyltransferase
MTARTKPPFRADHVGSLLRPASLKEAREKAAHGALTAAELKAVEDREIAKIIRKQEEIGLKLATDGEFRRAWWHFDFFGMLDGVEIYELDHGIQFQGVQTKAQSIRVTGKIGFSEHPMLEHFRFLAAHAKVMPKMTIPSPSVLHFRLEPGAVAEAAYPDRDAIFDDLAATYRTAVRAFYEARDRGMNVDHLQASYAAIINTALAGKPADMTITTHVCRGNFRSTWIASGGYEPVARSLLAGCNYDGYFLEYDTERAGGFEPLRFLPKGNKIVVLGLISSKLGALEKKDDIKRRIDEAAKFAPLGQLAVSPQCGFASTEEGNVLAEDEQWAKLRMAVEIAQEVWG